ncbi:Flp family type IVb pilin [candidate division KSB1 bacterium]|nr:Flp family type IVb pilin [candidate division KSB1 bacterium]
MVWLQLKKFLFVIKTFLQKNNGQTLMEYALIIFFVIIAVIVSLTLFGNQLLQLWQAVVAAF